ncbi:glycosyltransferase family 25 protein [Paraburkholderia sp. SIMBA_055]
MPDSPLPIHVISLERSGRRAALAKLLSDRATVFFIHDAIDAQTLSAAELAAAYDDEACRRRYGRSMTNAEVACFMSHRLVWRAIAESGRAAIVLEDDASFEPAFFERALFAKESEWSAYADVVLLGRSKLRREAARGAYLHEPLRCKTVLNGLQIGIPFKQWTSGAVGYWISADAARRALAYSDGGLSALLDDWPWHREHGGARVLEVRPYLVWEDFERLPSSIERERRARTALRAPLHDAALQPLRLARTAGRWSEVALRRLFGAAGCARRRHD